MRVVLHPEASAELRAAAVWYDERSVGLGEDLMAEVGATLAQIGTAPRSFPVWPGTSGRPTPARRAIVNRFPYVVAFEEHPDRIVVLAVAHAKRQPLYWLTRAEPGPA